MKSKLLLLAAFSLTLLHSCANPGISPGTNPGPARLNQSAAQPNRMAAQRPRLTRVEQLVERERMEKNLASLSGKIAFAPGTIIPERGTVKGRAMTRAFLTSYLEALGYKVELHEYRKNGINVTARLLAEEPTDEYIVVGAHMDSVSNAGADDNGSGSTAVLEAATLLPQLAGRKVNILFAWFDEEELGLIGSGYLARSLKKQGMKISSMHNVDMLGWDGDKDRTVELARPDGVLWDYYQMVNQTHGLKLPLERTNTGQSDHVSFRNEGYSSIMLSEEYTTRDSTPYYHRRGDTFETINFDFLASSTRLMIAAVGDLSMKVPPPPNIQLVPHDRFPARERHFHKSYEEAAAHLD
ncbi:MAG: hypothetical protein CVV27_04975 [Candidatus Melainabacteria bacterium HGW-Melainabacteria-1]|nr:MAG: hypothetical protein CVV27_04975 [Candidatus Melainabacteria bacterium HGW-Melainabacteria-1]